MTCKSMGKALGYIAACGVLALGLATAPQAGAVPVFSGTLFGESEPIDLLDVLVIPGDFNASFSNGDPAGFFSLDFQNTHASALVVSLVSATINQSQPNGLYFNTVAGEDYRVKTEFGTGNVHETKLIARDEFGLTAMVGAGDIITLMFSYGDVVGALSGAGPDIDFSIGASVVPLPAGLLLFLSGLAGIGFLGRYKAKRREPAVA